MPYAVAQAFPVFTDLPGKPLVAGLIYFGQPNQNPETQPQTVYWDEALTQPAPQPLRTVAGLIVRGGTPANVYLNGDYSITVRDSRRKLVFNAGSSAAINIGLLLTTFISNLASSNPLLGAALVNGALRTAPTIAALRLLPAAGSKVVNVLDYYGDGKGGGGTYAQDPADVTSPDNGGSVIVASDGARWKLRLQGQAPVNIRQFGCVCDGTADDTAKFTAADVFARAEKRTLSIVGTPLITANLVINAKTHWVFEGTGGRAAGDLPQSYLVKGAAVAGPVVTVAADGVKFEGGGVVERAGATGDCVAVWSNGFTWLRSPYLLGTPSGRDLLRIGRDVAPSNANSFFIQGIVCQAAGRHGINIDDKPGQTLVGPDANAGLIDCCLIQNCGGTGIRFGNAELGNTVICPTIEVCGVGLHYTAESVGNFCVGGDIEANTVNVIEDVRWTNSFVGTTVQGVVKLPLHENAQWTPKLIGLTTAGAQTASKEKGYYSLNAGMVTASVHIEWSAHSGSGQLALNFPNFTGTSIDGKIFANTPEIFMVQCGTEGFAVAAGGQVVGVIRNGSSPPQVQFYVLNAGVFAPLSVPPSGKIYFTAIYPAFAV